VVATPIGNLGDISRRMIRVLSEVDLIACEDTRHSRKLLTHLQIKTPLTSYYREKEQARAGALVEKLLHGQDIALVSDAGTPGISDPGAVLVEAARRADIRVVPVPGPSALVTALSAAGLPETDFYFGGFLPAKKSDRRRKLVSLRQLSCPLVFYESPHRIKVTLQDCLHVLGDRECRLFRELTKMHEEYLHGPLTKLIEKTGGKVRGELVLIVDGAEEVRQERPENLDELLVWYRDQNDMSLKDAVKAIAADLDLSRSKVYRKALEVWKK
jgi:16S rRNA (cytidine1402-2'-O)-methyltransferase